MNYQKNLIKVYVMDVQELIEIIKKHIEYIIHYMI